MECRSTTRSRAALSLAVLGGAVGVLLSLATGAAVAAVHPTVAAGVADPAAGRATPAATYRSVWRPATFAPARAALAGAPTGGGVSFFDGFEYGITRWTTVSGWQQDVTWAATTYRAASGSSSAYCVGTYVSPPGPYPNNVHNEMVAGPFDLSGTVEGFLEFDVWVDCPPEDQSPPHDYVWVGVFKTAPSANGGDGRGTAVWGHGGWTHYSIDLTQTDLGNLCGAPQVWIGIMFASDASASGEGAYLDNVSLTATPLAPSPSITGFQPISGPPGTSVTITGTNLGRAAAVTFGGAAAVFTTGDPGHITATVPLLATSGPITVTTSSGTATSTSSFTVTKPEPVDSEPPTVVAMNAVSVKRGQTATIRYRVGDPLPSCGSASVYLVIKRAGRTVWSTTLDDVPTNEARSCSFRCLLKRGSYRYYLSCRDDAGNSGTGVSSKSFTVR